MTSTPQAAQQASAAHANPTELRDQIKQSILAAQDAARQAAIEGAATTAPRGARTIRVTDGQADVIYGGQGPTLAYHRRS
jgi:hypothetical protein